MAETPKKLNPTEQARASIKNAAKSAKRVGKQAKVVTKKVATTAKHAPSYVKPSIDVAIKDATSAIKDLKKAGDYEYKKAQRITKIEAKKAAKLVNENKALVGVIIGLVGVIIGKTISGKNKR